MILKLISSTLFLLFLAPLNAQKAIYKIEFISNWSSTTHPTDYPTGSAHWSALIGASHNNAVSFFEIGQLATDGVEQVAESGSNTSITQEINASISNANTYKIIEGSGLSSGLGTITINDVEFDMNFPLVSLITMIAPSPDWVAQVNNIKMTDNNNDWLQSVTIDVHATDTGTDNGTTYASGNDDTSPAQNISSLENTTPFSNQFIGTFKFSLQQVLDVNDQNIENNFSIYPNPSTGKIFLNNTGNLSLEKIEIYAVNGKKLKEFTNLSNKKHLALESFSAGLYYLKLKTNKGIFIKKLVLQF